MPQGPHPRAGPGPRIRVGRVLVGAAPAPPGIAPRPIVGVGPEVGTRYAPRSGSVCRRRPPDRGLGLRLQPLHSQGHPREAAGDILSAVDLHPDR
eukprot:12229005-Alexandrium_andersonii.AAC.1